MCESEILKEMIGRATYYVKNSCMDSGLLGSNVWKNTLNSSIQCPKPQTHMWMEEQKNIL